MCKQASADFIESVTVFAVPEVCFDGFKFQKERVKESESFSQLQPKEQFVVAIRESIF